MRFGTRRPMERDINDYSQTWRLKLGSPRDLWPYRKYTPTETGRMNARSASVKGRREFYAWKVSMVACNTLYRMRHGWKKMTPIKGYGLRRLR